MGKANKKEVSNNLKAKDLSVEKRVELYQAALTQFDKESIEKYGMSVGAELRITKQGIQPLLVLVDVLAQQNEKNKLNETTK
jgi:hypothetical protein